jgi:predicted esterase
MEPDVHHFVVSKTARYFTLGKLDKDTKIVYLALHGYGQQAQKFIYKFDHLPVDTFVIVPEALSRFYWDEAKGITGASWMTKEDRANEIEDYCNYLDALLGLFSSEFPENAKLVLLGFSQGGATALRFFILKNLQNIDVLQIWASDLPPDLDYKENGYLFKKLKFFYVYGLYDEYISTKRIKQLKNRFLEENLNPEIIKFEGKHELDRMTMLKLHESLTKF